MVLNTPILETDVQRKVPVPNTYLSESTFETMKAIKIKYSAFNLLFPHHQYNKLKDKMYKLVLSYFIKLLCKLFIIIFLHNLFFQMFTMWQFWQCINHFSSFVITVFVHRIVDLKIVSSIKGNSSILLFVKNTEKYRPPVNQYDNMHYNDFSLVNEANELEHVLV